MPIGALIPKLRTTAEGQEKLCTKCSEWWPADTEFFYAEPKGAAGLFYCCKACFEEHFKHRRRAVVVEAPSWQFDDLARAIGSVCTA